jgi:pimeloyl-ACP methyl ester carboxylesterase
MADDDPTTPAEVREAMSQVYPNAQLHMFHGTGHAAPLLKRDEYLSAIEKFVTDV